MVEGGLRVGFGVEDSMDRRYEGTLRLHNRYKCDLYWWDTVCIRESSSATERSDQRYRLDIC